jgi:hypothetical protein
MSRRVSIALLLGLLICAVAAREFPELTSLSDNASNDYSAAVFQKGSSPSAAHQLPVVAAVAVIEFHIVEMTVPVVDSKSFELLSSFPDLLHLLCVQRT